MFPYFTRVQSTAFDSQMRECVVGLLRLRDPDGTGKGHKPIITQNTKCGPLFRY
jgi:hypothetical protein